MEKYHISSLIQDFVFPSRKMGCIENIIYIYIIKILISSDQMSGGPSTKTNDHYLLTWSFTSHFLSTKTVLYR